MESGNQRHFDGNPSVIFIVKNTLSYLQTGPKSKQSIHESANPFRRMMHVHIQKKEREFGRVRTTDVSFYSRIMRMKSMQIDRFSEQDISLE